ncbi:hypothetical protein [Amycolatopsis sp. WAC 01416]|uniref:hypothetical protein n=1 Tax=Amycolatopsis sp. WAC 01416 TaxID=2203196 RepID=UPI001F45B5EE|nr:hypothetical protein [Amycolatopsis sp. WAC 01416]
MVEDVLHDLGDKVVGALVDATSATRADLADYRDAFPGWVADSSERGLSNWIHDRLWAHLRRELTDVDSVELLDQGVTREVTVGLRYRARVKRHTGRDRVRSYATKSALAFWAQSEALEGLEEVRLGFGYRWDPEERVIGSTIVSLRDGLDKDAIWAVEVDAGASGAAGTSITWTPVDPSLPQIDLYEALARDEEDEAT